MAESNKPKNRFLSAAVAYRDAILAGTYAGKKVIDSKKWVFHKIFETYYDTYIVGAYTEKIGELADDFETTLMIVDE